MIREIGEERMNLKGRVNKVFGNFCNIKAKRDISLHAKISNFEKIRLGNVTEFEVLQKV